MDFQQGHKPGHHAVMTSYSRFYCDVTVAMCFEVIHVRDDVVRSYYFIHQYVLTCCGIFCIFFVVWMKCLPESSFTVVVFLLLLFSTGQCWVSIRLTAIANITWSWQVIQCNGIGYQKLTDKPSETKYNKTLYFDVNEPFFRIFAWIFAVKVTPVRLHFWWLFSPTWHANYCLTM